MREQLGVLELKPCYSFTMRVQLLLIFLCLFGCATAPSLTQEGRNVIFMRPKPGVCKVVKKRMHVFSLMFDRNTEYIRNMLMNEAAEIGGNVLELKEIYSGSDQAIADVYSCSEEYMKNYQAQLKN